MRPTGNDRILLAAFAILAVSSVSLKGAVGRANDERSAVRSSEVEAQLVDRLRAQGFATEVRRFRKRSALVFAARGDCRLAARNARGGTMYMTVFASDAEPVGAIRYLYRGSSYGSPPNAAMRLGRLEYEMRTRLGMPATAHLAIALAASPGCGESTFGLEDLSVS